MDNKFLFLIGGLIIGFWFAKKRAAKQLKAERDEIAASAQEEAGKLFESILSKAEQLGLSVGDVRAQLNNA